MIRKTAQNRFRRRGPQFVTIGVVLLLTLEGCASADVAAARPWHERPIDTALSEDMKERLSVAEGDARAAAAAEVEASPARFNPEVFYLVALVHIADDRPQDAMFWFYAGQLRARFDANRCADELAGTYVNRLNEHIGPPINQYAFQHLDQLEATVTRVLEFDRTTPHSYDPRWINAHTPAAMTAAMTGETLDPTTMSKPEAEWPAIAERTRTEYEKGFAEALAKARE